MSIYRRYKSSYTHTRMYGVYGLTDTNQNIHVYTYMAVCRLLIYLIWVFACVFCAVAHVCMRLRAFACSCVRLFACVRLRALYEFACVCRLSHAFGRLRESHGVDTFEGAQVGDGNPHESRAVVSTNLRALREARGRPREATVSNFDGAQRGNRKRGNFEGAQADNGKSATVSTTLRALRQATGSHGGSAMSTTLGARLDAAGR